MTNVLELTVFLSISGSLIAVILFLLKPIAKKKFTKTWNYYIWLAVIIKLLIPINPPVNIVNVFEKIPNQKQEITNLNTNNKDIDLYEDVETLTNIGDQKEFISFPIEETESNNISYYENNESIVEYASNTFEFSWIVILDKLKACIGYIWITIVLVLLIKKFANYYIFLKFIKKASEKIEDENILEVYYSICKSFNINNTPALYKSKIINSPMLVGIRKSLIILPDNQIDFEYLQYIFMHELTHYKRFDILYKWLVEFTLCIHWFNPIVYFVSRDINKLCDLSCDETVIKKLAPKEQRIYGDTLIRSLELGGNSQSGLNKNNVVSLTLTTNSKLMKERLISIMKFNKKTKTNIFISSVLAVILFACSMFMGVYAQNKSDMPENVISDLPEVNTAPISSNKIDSANLDNISPLSYTGLSLHGFSHHWASATGIEGNTYKKQLNKKLEYIEKIYIEKNEGFVIFESIPEEEITNILGIQYLFEQSQIYRDLITVADSITISSKESSGFQTSLADKGYERTTFYIDKASDLKLELDYEFTEGKMGVYVVSSNGEYVYKKEPVKSLKETVDIQLDKGIWSIILVNEYENGTLAGVKGINGKIYDANLDSTIKADNNPHRITIEQLSNEMKTWVEECDKKQDLYITLNNDIYYVYCNMIQKDFAWEYDIDIDTDDEKNNYITAELYDYDSSSQNKGYALLSIPYYPNIAVYYKDKSVQFTNNESENNRANRVFSYYNEYFKRPETQNRYNNLLNFYEENKYVSDNYDEKIDHNKVSLEFDNFTGSKIIGVLDFEEEITLGFSIKADVNYLKDNTMEYKIAFISEDNQVLRTASTYNDLQISNPIIFPKGKINVALVGESISGYVDFDLSSSKTNRGINMPDVEPNKIEVDIPSVKYGAIHHYGIYNFKKGDIISTNLTWDNSESGVYVGLVKQYEHGNYKGFIQRGDGKHSESLVVQEDGVYFIEIGNSFSPNIDAKNVKGEITITRLSEQNYFETDKYNKFNVNISNPNEYSIECLGKHSLKKDNTVLSNINWNGDGTVMVLYTEEEYSVNDITNLIDRGILPLQIPNITFNGVEKNNDIESNFKYRSVDKEVMLNFTMSSEKIDSNMNVLKDGNYNFYVIAIGNENFKDIKGKVVFED